MNASTYHEILKRLREICIVKSLKQGILAGHVCRVLSPYFSALFIKLKYSPNKITVFMILFGIIGSILFMIPNIWCKIIGYVFWFLWFTMDLCDGEVARYTQTFSKYGVEMDYMAHLIDHPLMNISLWLTFLSLNKIDPFILSLIFIISISIELSMRNIIAFQHYHQTSNGFNYQRISFVKYILTQILLYPNLIILFTPLILLDYYFKIGFSIYIYILWFAYSLIMCVRTLIKQLLSFYRG